MFAPMPEHVIRLRGPWELLLGADDGGTPARIDLPADRPPATDRPLRLRRRFGRPARLPRDVPCSIRVEDVPGLVRITLNGTTLAESPAVEPGRAGAIEVPCLVALKLRNLLELDVLPGPASAGGPGRCWGSIALVFPLGDPPAG